jgi:uncharacterized membrane protein YhhN
MKFNYVTAAIIFCGLLAIAGSYGWPDQTLYYIFKPATTILILFVALTAPASKYKILIVIGILFSLMGDIFLMLPSDQFLLGLICFLITHICYIVAFLLDSRFGRPLWPYVLLAAIAIAIFELLSGGIDATMKLPVAIYAAALSFMTAQAIARYLQHNSAGSQLAAIGAALFLISDTALAYDRFVSGFIAAHAIILATYYAAQYLIARSANWNPGVSPGDS